jgi:hypothetical protein
MLVYVHVSLFVSTCVYVSFCLILLKTLFDYHNPYLFEIFLEVSIIPRLIFIYDFPYLCTTNHSIYLCHNVIGPICVIGIVCIISLYVIVLPYVQLII